MFFQSPIRWGKKLPCPLQQYSCEIWLFLLKVSILDITLTQKCTRSEKQCLTKIQSSSLYSTEWLFDAKFPWDSFDFKKKSCKSWYHTSTSRLIVNNREPHLKMIWETIFLRNYLSSILTCNCSWHLSCAMVQSLVTVSIWNQEFFKISNWLYLGGLLLSTSNIFRQM